MSEMLERAARALFDWENEPRGSDEEFERDKAYWLQPARAVLKAMREPTEEMICTAECVENDDFGGMTDRDHAEEIWQAMIDAALSESPTRLPVTMVPVVDPDGLGEKEE